MNPRSRWHGWGSAVGACLVFSGAALAQGAPAVGSNVSLSAFGTVGWAQSNQPWRTQRFIDEHGSARRDSVFGAQLDAQLTPQWSATLQGKLAPSMRDDKRYDLTASWAFVAWRPNNDWLLRLGKLRVPLFMRSEQLDVGQTYDEVRLLPEVYSIVPTSDFTGGHASRTWNLEAGDLSLDAYRGSARMAQRSWLREDVPGFLAAGAMFREVDVRSQGLVATLRAPELTARAGVHHVRTRMVGREGLTVRPVAVTLGPGMTYYQTDNETPGPGVELADEANNYVVTAGAEASFSGGWRVAGEVARIVQHDTELGNSTLGGYLSVYKRWGDWTPYVSLAALRSVGESTGWARTLDNTTLPPVLPGGAATLINAGMRATADSIPVYRQRSLAFGAAYALTLHSKLKFEWMRTQATLSSMFDLPAGEPLEASRRVDVLSLNYSFAF